MRQPELHLPSKARELIESYRAKGLHDAREVNRAHILSAPHRGIAEAQIMAVLGVDRTAIWRTRSAYLERGVDYALRDRPRPAAPVRHGCRRRFLRWPARNHRRAPPAGRSNCCSRRRRQALARSAASPSPAAKKNCLKPWRKLLWCVGSLTQEYRERMYDLLDLNARPFCPEEPVVCLDDEEQTVSQATRAPLPIKPGTPMRLDYEYVRAGTCNLFVAVGPKGGRRIVMVTDRRAKADFVTFVRQLLEQAYATARRIHLVLDNRNTHFRKCVEDVLGVDDAGALLRRVEFHYTPKHAS